MKEQFQKKLKQRWRVHEVFRAILQCLLHVLITFLIRKERLRDDLIINRIILSSPVCLRGVEIGFCLFSFSHFIYP